MNDPRVQKSKEVVQRALEHIRKALLSMSASEALVSITSEKLEQDTLGLDAVAERALCETIREKDAAASVISEEGEGWNSGAEVVYVADPFDESKKFATLLKREHFINIATVITDGVTRWEKLNGEAELTGARSAITVTIDGIPVYSLSINHFTGNLFECEKGNAILKQSSGEKALVFPNISKGNWEFGTYLGKNYRDHFDSLPFPTKATPISASTGPGRMLYFTKGIRGIVANGEKLGEWIHWMPFFGKEFTAYEILLPDSLDKGGIPMAARNTVTSLFVRGTTTRLDMEKILKMKKPENCRSTLVVGRTNDAELAEEASRLGWLRI